MYGKIFESIFDSTLVSDGGFLPAYIFMSMVVLGDKNGIVSLSKKALYRRLGFRDYDSKISYEDFEAAIEYLCQEDPESNSKKEDGKRLIPLSDMPDIEENRGWFIVTYEDYRKKGSRTEQKGSSTERVRRHRQRQKNQQLSCDETVCNGNVTDGNGHTDTDTDIKKNKQKKKVSCPWKKDYPPADLICKTIEKHGKGFNWRSVFENFIDDRQAKGVKYVDWEAAWRGWSSRHVEWNKNRQSNCAGNMPQGSKLPEMDSFK